MKSQPIREFSARDLAGTPESRDLVEYLNSVKMNSQATSCAKDQRLIVSEDGNFKAINVAPAAPAQQRN
jgi:hypothetical protein